ncbi:MAG: hypothetical protein C0599_17965 [Salinivirgaceae bacterium]|nr:MAG: hypothetical protein C0599_17965 [Salinivirgaceae bacterium]
MPTKTRKGAESKSSNVLQGKWGKSIAPPGKQPLVNQKKGDGLYLGKTIAPPAQKKSEGNGSALPGKVQKKMENSFGADFSNVKVHPNSSKASQLKAQAFTQGNNIHFAPGKYNPESQSGQALIGHELTHVEQQRAGKVKPTTQAKGYAINDDASLEKEADQKGAMAAKGQVVNEKAKSTQLKSNDSSQPVQRSLWSKIKKGAKKVGGAIKKGVKKIGKGISKGVSAIGSGIKKGVKWLKDKKDAIAYIIKSGSFIWSLFSFLKDRNWKMALASKNVKPPGVFSKFLAVTTLITGPFTIKTAISKIFKSSDNKKLVKNSKPARTEDEKKAKENISGIQNIRIAMAAATATDAVMSMASAIMTLAGVATMGIGAAIAGAISIIQLVMSGAKLAYQTYRKMSKKYKEKVKAENEQTAKGMISLQDANLYKAIGMGADNAKPKDNMRVKLSDLKKQKIGNKDAIIEHLNKEREDAANS